MKISKKLLVLVACVLIVSFISVTTLLAAEETITGTVAKKDAGFIIKTDKGDYEATGGGVEKFVDKKVKATGDVEGMKITIKKIEEE